MEEYEKEKNRIKGIIISVTYTIIAIVILFIISITKVDALSYKFNTPTLHRICEGNLIGSQSGLCTTNNNNNIVNALDSQKGQYIQVAYRSNNNNTNITGDTYQPGDYSIAFSGYFYSTMSYPASAFKVYLLYYPDSSNQYARATCDSSEIFRVTSTGIAYTDGRGNEYYYTYSCDTLSITSGKTYIGYEIYLPEGIGKINVFNYSKIDQNMVIGGPSETQDIINNFNKNFNDLIDNQNQNTDKVVDAITGPGLSEESKKPIDKEGINDFKEKENALVNKNELDKINDIDIVIDTDSNTFIWNLITRILNTNALIFGMIITILSIGLIKLLLNR